SRPLRPPDPRADLDGIISLARALLSDTKGFLALLKTRYPAEGDHQLESLPVLAMSALELANIQTAGLSRVAADLQRYRRLLEWLRRAGLRPLEPELGALQGRLERLLRRLDHLV
ncbi:IL11 protein, partial [Rhinopomastus cyanomelas]|nr:IL11 protein [Rhinopomastus cyanomelas]